MSTADELMSWWMQQAETEAGRTIPKAVEYGSNSMLDLGRAMSRAMHREDMSDEECMELSCYFYIQGKMGRWLDAIVAGRRPGDDTPYDIGVYAKMVQRIRETGSWPGTAEMPTASTINNVTHLGFASGGIINTTPYVEDGEETR